MAGSILVTGGTGTLGRAVVARLAAAGQDPVVLSRRRAAPAGVHARWRVGDLDSGEGLDQALAQTGTVIHCASSSDERDVAASRNLLEAAHRAGTPHLVYISIVGIDRMSLNYYRAKLEVEHLVEESGLPWTILRATQFHEFVLWFFTTQRRLPVLAAPARVSVQPVEVGEVADRLVELAFGQPSGRVPDMGGPQVRPVAEFARSYLTATGSRRPVLPVPAPGKVMREFRQGEHLAPGHATGRRTFDDFLAGQV